MAGMRNGQLEKDELWVRCIFCGDSEKDPEKAHFSINVQTFVYHCLRCGKGGRLSLKQAFEIIASLDLDETLYLDMGSKSELSEDPLELPELELGAGSSRPSALGRHHYTQGKIVWDAFEMRHPRDNVVSGVHLRTSGKHLSLGDRGFGWVSDGPLLSSPEDPLRLVEGPYDVVTPRDVCVFGILAASQIRTLGGHSIILCPDGDVWTKRKLLKRFVRAVQTMLNAPFSAPFLVGLEFLPDGKDPDEVPVDQRQYIQRGDILRFFRDLASNINDD